VLISRGFHVILCNGKFTKNIKGVLDCLSKKKDGPGAKN